MVDGKSIISPEELAKMKEHYSNYRYAQIYATPLDDIKRLIAEVERLMKRNDWLSAELSAAYSKLEALL